MDWLNDLLYFLAMPILIVVMAAVLYRGNQPRGYKIVRVSNNLDEERYEVWFDYPASPFVQSTWSLKETFDSLKLAEDYLARQRTEREIIKEGPL